MTSQPTVLLLGSTGRTGGRVLAQLLGRGILVRALVRSVQKLPASVAAHPNLQVVEAEVLALSEEELRRQVQGCDAIISCLGHVLSIRGIYGPPYDLVTQATARVCQAIEAFRPDTHVKVILMSSVSVNHPAGLDTRRGRFEKALVGLIRGLLPPAKDNQEAANLLYEKVGLAHPFVQWTVIRPDSLLEGEVSEYALHEGLVNSLFAPGSTHMANVAHFMGELITNPKAWEAWQGKLPVIVDGNRENRKALCARETTKTTWNGPSPTRGERLIVEKNMEPRMARMVANEMRAVWRRTHTHPFRFFAFIRVPAGRLASFVVTHSFDLLR